MRLQVLQHRDRHVGVRQVERDARHQQPVHPALQHRGRAERPDRKLHDQRVGLAQAAHVVGHQRLVLGQVVVVAPLVRPHHRIEFLRIEIAQVDRVAGFLQPGERLGADRGVEAFGEGMAVDVVDFQSRRSTAGRARMRHVYGHGERTRIPVASAVACAALGSSVLHRLVGPHLARIEQPVRIDLGLHAELVRAGRSCAACRPPACRHAGWR